MRYYRIDITNPDTGNPVYLRSLKGLALTSLLPSGPQNPIYGRTNPAALQIELDGGTSNQTDPDSNGAYLRIWGVGLEDLGNAKDFNFLNISVSAGMAKGLPLANPQQAGVVISGTISQAFGNWIGTEQTLDFIITPGGSSGDAGGSSGGDSGAGNFPFNWPANTPITAAIAQTLSTGLPGIEQSIHVSTVLVANYDVVGFYTSLKQFADFIDGLSVSLVGKDYPGITIALNDNAVSVSDGTGISAGSLAMAQVDGTVTNGASAASKLIEFQSLIGQPTWIGSGVISVKTVLRADIQVNDIVTLPPTIANATGAAFPAYSANPSQYAVNFGGGKFQVSQVHHFGNFRQPAADAWATTYQMYSVDV